MHMAAIVELAMIGMRMDIWHASGQTARSNMVQAKSLKPRRVHQGGFFSRIHPIPRGGCGGVFARLQGLRDDVSCGISVGNQSIDKRTFARTRRAEYQGNALIKLAMQIGQIKSIIFQAQGQNRATQLLVGEQLLPSPLECFCEVLFVQANQGAYAFMACSNQGTS